MDWQAFVDNLYFSVLETGENVRPEDSTVSQQQIQVYSIHIRVKQNT
jgi:hypothetical protein